MKVDLNDITIPPQYLAAFQSIQEMEPAALIAKFTQGYPRVLNVGPSWGRDYYALTRAGHQVFNLDIALQQHLPQMTIANLAQAVPFREQTFDAILLPEVLEHIWNDVDALREARRVLKDNGRLVVTVPFFSDSPEYHVRIHSPRSILRLLRSSGFEPLEYIERGGWVSFPRLAHGFRKLLQIIGRGDAFMRWVIEFDEGLGRQKFVGLRWLAGYGCLITATKSHAVDFERLNATEFRHA